MAEFAPEPPVLEGQPGVLHLNRLRSTWRGLANAAGLVAAGLGALATVTLLLREPRLFTLAELVPPDESLVGAYIPAGVGLAIALVVAARLRHIPATVRIDEHGFTAFSDRAAELGQVRWGEISAMSSGSRWEGREVRTNAAGSYFVSVELAEAIEKRWRSASPSDSGR